MAFLPVPNLGDKFTSDPFCNNLPRTGLFLSFVQAWKYKLLQLVLDCEKDHPGIKTFKNT